MSSNATTIAALVPRQRLRVTGATFNRYIVFERLWVRTDAVLIDEGPAR